MSTKNSHAGTEMSTLGNVATYINGRAFKPSEWEDSGLPIIRIQNLTNFSAPYNYSSRELEEKYKVTRGDLLFAWSASLGAHIWKGNDAWLNQHIFRVVPSEQIEKKYLYYFLLQVVAELHAKTHGSGMVHITKGPFMNTPIPVPSLPEQKRIVSKIEELFSKLDASAAELQTAKEKLKVYRQAVLKEAFDPVSKEKILLEDIIEKPRYGTSKKCSYAYKNGFKAVYRIPNICYQNGSIDHKDIKYAGFSDDELKNLDLIENDLLIIRSNGSVSLVGRSSIVKAEDCDATFAGYLIRLRLKKPSEVLSKFLHYFLESHAARTYIEHVAKSTSGVNNINSNEISNLPVPKCDDFDMQAQTVVKIETNLSICDDIQQTIDTSLQQAEALRQSILKQAFEGEL